MRLKPLEQWFCDRCNQVIESATDGAVHWRHDKENRVHSMEILHIKAASPRSGEHGCFPADAELDVELRGMLGARGAAEMLALIDVGKFHDEMGRHVGSVKDQRNWADTFRRLQIPYFEQARKYFVAARSDGMLEGMSEVTLYLEETLRDIVERYSE